MNKSSEKKLHEKQSRPSTKSTSKPDDKTNHNLKDEPIRKNKVVFKASNPPSLDLEQNLPDRCNIDI